MDADAELSYSVSSFQVERNRIDVLLLHNHIVTSIPLKHAEMIYHRISSTIIILMMLKTEQFNLIQSYQINFQLEVVK